jgi:hypothetical protein
VTTEFNLLAGDVELLHSLVIPFVSSLVAEYGAPERVYVENEWHDGPRAGVANIGGASHRFVSQWDEEEGEHLGTFLVWPIDEAELTLEQEQWQIFVKWNEEYEAGKVGTESHPGCPGTNKRWDAINSLLEPRRRSVPEGALRAKVQMVHLENQRRYASTGPAYQLAWRLLLTRPSPQSGLLEGLPFLPS